MARRLRLSAREMPGELVGTQRAQARARRHVARMVITFVIGKRFTSSLKSITLSLSSNYICIKYKVLPEIRNESPNSLILYMFNLFHFQQYLSFAFCLIMCLCSGSI